MRDLLRTQVRPSARQVHGPDRGFTLIELLVVMLIIGILAAIAIPVFLSQRATTQDTAAKSDAAILGREIFSYYVEGTTAPTVMITSGRYSVSGTDVGKTSSGNYLVNTYGPLSAGSTDTALTGNSSWSASAWCLAIYNGGGHQKVWRFSKQNGLEAGNCYSATSPTP